MTKVIDFKKEEVEIPSEFIHLFSIEKKVLKGWESYSGWYWFATELNTDGYHFGYVLGFENEWGSVDLAEIKPYIVSIARGKELDHIMPPEGYFWENEKEFA